MIIKLCKKLICEIKGCSLKLYHSSWWKYAAMELPGSDEWEQVNMEDLQPHHTVVRKMKFYCTRCGKKHERITRNGTFRGAGTNHYWKGKIWPYIDAEKCDISPLDSYDDLELPFGECDNSYAITTYSPRIVYPGMNECVWRIN